MKKRFLALAMALTMSVALIGCGEKANNEGETSEGTESGAVVETETQDPNETFSLADYPGSTPIEYGDLKLSEWVTLNGDYKGLNLTINNKPQVREEDVLNITLSTYNQLATFASPDNTVVDDGETVNIDFVGVMDGETEPFQGGSAEGYTLGIGTGSFIDGFEAGLVGVNVGDTVDLHLNFPDPYDPNPDLSGAGVVFTVTVNYIHAQSKEDMLDEEIEKFTEGEYKDVDSFMGYCEEYLNAAAEYNYNAGREEAVVNALETLATVNTFYGDMLDRYTKRVTDNLSNDAAQYGLDADTYCAYTVGLDAATYIRLSAETSTKQSMIMMLIAEKENISVTDAEIEEKVAEMNADGTASVLDSYDTDEIREYLLFQKVVAFVIENGNVTWVDGE